MRVVVVMDHMVAINRIKAMETMMKSQYVTLILFGFTMGAILYSNGDRPYRTMMVLTNQTC